ncbi:hypothetical protein RCG63_02725 [Lactococcus lactis]|uniref:IrrE N-terminal-like domain-containing protein n=1 Tax=Lactococcus lactis TaxID=1358 RepID=A0ABD5GM14_9LACT|nr:hypothetical protein [Lactococcus lactis]MDQ7158909.1 hypothetical protein [Lactococcus lactis]MDV2618169.1 hypothetical protein [Lactococcus lactis]
MDDNIYTKALEILKKNHITLLYDDIYPIKENGKFVRAKGQKFIVLKRTLNDKVDIILTILHECSHAISDDDLHVINKMQLQHAEYLAECNKIKDYINLNATEYGTPTTNIPALMESMHVSETSYYEVFEKEIRKYYNSDGSPRSEWEID